jgi:hypothetical protein
MKPTGLPGAKKLPQPTSEQEQKQEQNWLQIRETTAGLEPHLEPHLELYLEPYY